MLDAVWSGLLLVQNILFLSSPGFQVCIKVTTLMLYS